MTSPGFAREKCPLGRYVPALASRAKRGAASRPSARRRPVTPVRRSRDATIRAIREERSRRSNRPRSGAPPTGFVPVEASVLVIFVSSSSSRTSSPLRPSRCLRATRVAAVLVSRAVLSLSLFARGRRKRARARHHTLPSNIFVLRRRPRGSKVRNVRFAPRPRGRIRDRARSSDRVRSRRRYRRRARTHSVDARRARSLDRATLWKTFVASIVVRVVASARRMTRDDERATSRAIERTRVRTTSLARRRARDEDA